MHYLIIDANTLSTRDFRATTYVPGGAISRAEVRLVAIAKTQARLRAEKRNLRAKIVRLRAGLGQ